MTKPAGVAPLLQVDGLSVRYAGARGPVEAVRGISFSIQPGEIFGLIGESGSGKTTVCTSLLGLQPRAAHVTADAITFEGENLGRFNKSARRQLRGRRIALVPQHPMNSLSPTTPVSRQLRWYLGSGQRSNEVKDRLRTLGLGGVLQRLDDLPSQFSGGQLQRLIIGIATLTHRPTLLLADEPTTTLDCIAQTDVLRLLLQLRDQLGLSILYVSHDLAVVAQICDRVGVMRAGELVEVAPVEDIFRSPQHPYTKTLIESVTSTATSTSSSPLTETLKRRADAPRAKPSTKPEHRRVTIAVPLQELPPPMFEASGVCKRFGSGAVTSNAHEFAVDEVSFTVRPGEVFAVVGESGAGKSTLARIITGLTAPTFGSLRIDGRELAPQRPQTDRRLIQLVGQNPRTALNRRYRVRHALEQPLKVHGIAATSREREQLIMHGIERVGLSASHLSRRPSDLSGGELARVVLVRALLARPRMLVLDEPTSNLDATTKLTIQELLADLCAADHLSVILITHEIDVARRLSDRAAVMLAGQLVEVGPSEQVLHCPVHPYARSLLASVLTVDPASRTLALPAAAAGVDP